MDWKSLSSCAADVAHLVWEIIAIHLITVGLTTWTLNLDAMALQDGCFFKNTNFIIAYQLYAAAPTNSNDENKLSC